MRREWRIRISWLVIGVLLGSLPQCTRFWKIDRCLDQGGTWNEKTGKCEF